MAKYPSVGWAVDGSLRMMSSFPPMTARTLQQLLSENGGDEQLLEWTRVAMLGSPVEGAGGWDRGYYLFTLLPMRTRLGAVSGVYTMGRRARWGGPSDEARLSTQLSTRPWLDACLSIDVLTAQSLREVVMRRAPLTPDPLPLSQQLAQLCQRTQTRQLRATSTVPDELPDAGWADGLVTELREVLSAVQDTTPSSVRRPTWVRLLTSREAAPSVSMLDWPEARQSEESFKIELRCHPARVLNAALRLRARSIYTFLRLIGGVGTINVHAIDEQPSLTIWLPLPPAGGP